MTKQGKVLLARQFVEMTRMKVENHLATFPKLIGSDRQHNTVETAEVRYVYQPIENLILVLTTSKLSNIVEDLETLRLFSKLIPEHCPGEIDEAAVCRNAFELLFAFDELIACGIGYREDLSLQQVQVNLEMESHEEKLALMIRQSKEREAQQEATKRAKDIAKAKRTQGLGGGGIGNAVGSMRDFAEDMQAGAARATAAIEAAGATVDPSSTPSYSSAPPPKAGTGMRLGAGKGKGTLGAGGAGLLQAMAAEAGAAEVAAPSGGGAGAGASPGGAGMGAAAANVAFQLNADEKLTVSMSRDGGLQSMELNGQLNLLSTDPATGSALVPLRLGPNAGYQFKTHPHIDKAKFNGEGIITTKDGGARPFPTGSQVGVLKWRMSNPSDESLVPLVVNAWPTQTGGATWEVSVEYELATAAYPGLEIHNLTVTLPTPGLDAPPQLSASAGSANYSRRDGAVTWHVPLIDASSSSGTVELNLSGLTNADSLYPIQVGFQAPHTLCKLEVPGVQSAEGQPLPFNAHASLTVESYTIA